MKNLQLDTQSRALIRVDDAGKARFVRLPEKSIASPSGKSSMDKARKFFRRYGEAFGVADVDRELVAAKTFRDSSGVDHAVLKQVYRGIPVFGGELRAHFNDRGDLFAANGSFVDNIKVDPEPTLSQEVAGQIGIRKVFSYLQQAKDQRRTSGEPATIGADESEMEHLSAASVRLVVFNPNLLRGLAGGASHLAYEVEVVNAGPTVREFVYVDAHRGTVLQQITGIHEALNRRAFDAEGQPHPGPNYPGSPFWSEGDAFPTTSTEADNMILASAETYDLFFNAFGYDSFDGAGATMDAIFNRGDSCPNASWNGVYISFCPGLTTDDVTAHEWGHAYTDYTNNLIYFGQSGALNESYSDIWGETVDQINGRDDLPDPDGPRTDGACSTHGGLGSDNSVRWLMGEDVNATGLVGAIRDMWNPNCYGDPGKVTNDLYWCSAGDGYGVHINSGIPNHAYALMVDGGSYNGETITGMGLVKAAHIEWAAQNMLTPASNFVDNADALEAACSALIGVNLTGFDGNPSGEMITAGDCTEVGEAVAAVEMRAFPDECNFDTVLDPDAPALCGGGTVNSLLLEDFEGGSLPAGWTASAHDVANPGTFDNPGWDVVTDLPGGATGTYAAFAPDLNQGDCAADDESGAVALDSPVITLPVGEVPHVAFDHWVATEDSWDGGNLKISVNAGPWTQVPSGAYSFNAYNGVLNSPPGNTNPLADEDAFTGADEGFAGGSWGQSQVALLGLAAAGDDVQLRFDLGVDGCFGLVGWYVDSFHAFTCPDDQPPVCGDGALDLGEECDDANTADGDGCSATCQVEDGWVCDPPTTGIADPDVAEGFEGGSVPPPGWTTVVNNPDETWQVHTFDPNSGAFAAEVLFDPQLVPQDEWLVSPSFTPSADTALEYASTGSLFWCRDTNDNCDLEVWIVVGAVGGANDIFVGRADDYWPASFEWVDIQEDLSGLLPGGPISIGFRYVGVDGAQVVLDDIRVGEVVSTPSVCMEIVEDVACNQGTVDFIEGIPGSWTVVDNEGTGVVWTNIADAFAGGFLIPGNFTGGDGEAASVSSDAFFVTEFDTELISNSFSLTNAASASLEYLANYQNLLNLDFLDLDISVDGGTGWTNLLSWNEDHGAFAAPPGEAVSVDLAGYVGASDVRLRWRYYDPNTDDWDWYAQVDNVGLTCNLNPDCDGAGVTPDLLWPPNHRYRPISIEVSDPDGDPVTVTVDSIFQDEPLGNNAPDAIGVGTSNPEVRSERLGQGDGRVYTISFTADDGRGGTCTGSVEVGVPHDQGNGSVPVNGGAIYDSTGS